LYMLPTFYVADVSEMSRFVSNSKFSAIMLHKRKKKKKKKDLGKRDIKNSYMKILPVYTYH